MSMELSAENEERLCVVTVQDGRIDAAVALEFKERVRQLTEAAQRAVLLDLSQVDFIDSSGLGAIVSTMKHLSPDRELVLSGLTPTVARVFKLTRRDSVFAVYSTREAAVDDLG